MWWWCPSIARHAFSLQHRMSTVMKSTLKGNSRARLESDHQPASIRQPRRGFHSAVLYIGGRLLLCCPVQRRRLFGHGNLIKATLVRGSYPHLALRVKMRTYCALALLLPTCLSLITLINRREKFPLILIAIILV